ncbi:PadR family transcriptional regulator [Adlercreutzia sp. R21]|uniref:PadR family transcriptional regulator n=1 Tax=Adlercreutzia wanghongyangiae TaxID=3111451 RepID=A0ABU6IGU1_9ACTN|nr:PadR family transcriptional regulator [Adlercreutzia sp. R21]MEC4175596.1 PadR family transcriptional regulator [Adlercreutzia sp. R7]MEC4183451.1 PadR family transcriptional regulator [Adlercreutzia sp. R21]
MTGSITEMLKGTLEGCVMQLIDEGDAYGYEITRKLNELGLSDVVEGTVYAILVRLEKRGLVEVEKRPSELGPPRKFYTLNAEGKAELEQFWEKWAYLKSTIDRLKEGI